MKKVSSGFEEILNPQSKEVSDRQLLEEIYYHLLALHVKIDKLGLLKYQEMGVSAPEQFVGVLNDNTTDKILENNEKLSEISTAMNVFKQELLENYYTINE